MRNPRPEAFDSKSKQRQPDKVDLSGVVPLIPQKPLEQNVYGGTVAHSVETATTPLVSRYHGGMVSHPPDTTLPVSDIELMKMVRKAVKEFGKEAATHRFTADEKKKIAEIVYAYRGQGIRTSENEITRIAINYLFYDYKCNGQNSILHKSLHALNE
jgi:hypothetical protein